jgi:hypothetical protein
MSDPGQDRARLKKVVDEPIATLTAVEVDTVARAQEIIADLRPGAADRPSAVVELDARASSPDAVLARARAATEGFPAAVGVLFVVDTTGGGAHPPVEFWRGFNFLRESWAALGAHVVFFLQPQSYRLLVTEADHFADWVPLRFHFLGAGAAVGAATQDAHAALDFGLLAPEVARQELIRLEAALRRALVSGAPPAALTRRYYLPLLGAALSLGDRHRARALVAEVDEDALAESDRPVWWELAARHFLEDRDLAAAERMVDRLTADAEAHQDERALVAAAFYGGTIALERRDFAAAAEWYREVPGDFGEAGHRARRGEHLPPTGDGRPRAARLRDGGRVVPQVPGDFGETEHRARRGDQLPPTGEGRPRAARLRRGGRVVPQVPGDFGEAGHRARRRRAPTMATGE